MREAKTYAICAPDYLPDRSISVICTSILPSPLSPAVATRLRRVTTLPAFSRDTSLPPARRAIGRPAGVGAPRGFMACRTVSTTALGVDRGARDG